MSDEEKIKDEDEEEILEDASQGEEHEEENAEAEWVGEEWGEEEIEEEDYEEKEVPTFIDKGDGTISDTGNKIMWCRTDSYAEFGYGITWFEANDYCESLNEKKFAGYDDWRLPSFDDAKALFSFSKSNFDKDGAEVHIDPLFEEGGGHNTWTYDEKPDYQQYAMKFSYVTGNEMWENKDNEYSHVRAVRDEADAEEWEPEWRKDSKKFER